jgi:RNase adaptor protein for sRNA GlmZ degradation
MSEHDGQPFIAFLTGSSASGKSTAFETLKDDPDLAAFGFHDIDEIDVPPVAHGPWGTYRELHLFYNAKQALKDGRSSVICGLTRPHELLIDRVYDSNLPVYFVLLEASDAQISERLSKRIDELVASGNSNESFNENTREEAVIANLNIKRLLHNTVDSLKCGYVIDVSELTTQAVHEQVKQQLLKFGEAS